MVATKCPTLEICIDSLESALSALNGGADRLELCSALSEGGLTPTTAMVRAVQKLSNTKTPVYCMVRPRGGPMIYAKLEQDLILTEIADLKQNGADGIVFGALTSSGDIDVELCQKVIKACGDLPCTFHRAFDLCRNPLDQLEVIIDMGFERILTSGCSTNALEGSEMIQKLVERSNGRISIMGGAGVKAQNCIDLLSKTKLREIHASAKVKKAIGNLNNNNSHVRMGATDDAVVYVTSSTEVAAIKSLLKDYVSNGC